MDEHIAGPEQIKELAGPLRLLGLHGWQGTLVTAWGDSGENLWLFIVTAEGRKFQASDPSLSCAVKRAVLLAANGMKRNTTLNFDES